MPDDLQRQRADHQHGAQAQELLEARLGVPPARHRTGVVGRLSCPALPQDTESDSERPNIEAGFAPLGMVGADAGDTAKEQLDSAGYHDVENMQLMGRPTCTVIVQMLHPRSRGRVSCARRIRPTCR